LVFPDPGNPFSEKFEQEEVVAGGPGKPDAAPPQGSDAIGGAQPVDPQQAATIGVTEGDDAAEMLAAINELRREGPGSVEFGSLDDSDSRTDAPQGGAPQESRSDAEIAASAGPLGRDAGSGGVFADGREPLEAGAVEDEDLIVVEEQYRDEYPSIRPIAAARRQEYRQLFARLRRG